MGFLRRLGSGTGLSRRSSSRLSDDAPTSVAGQSGSLQGAGQTDAHLSQLAVLENYSEHRLQVAFSEEEVAALERSALEYALMLSQQEAQAQSTTPPEMSRASSMRSSSTNLPAAAAAAAEACSQLLPHDPLSPEEANRVVAVAANETGATMSSGGTPSAIANGSGGTPTAASSSDGGPAAPETPRQQRLGSLRRAFSSFKRGSAEFQRLPPLEATSSVAMPLPPALPLPKPGGGAAWSGSGSLRPSRRGQRQRQELGRRESAPVLPAAALQASPAPHAHPMPRTVSAGDFGRLQQSQRQQQQRQQQQQQQHDMHYSSGQSSSGDLDVAIARSREESEIHSSYEQSRREEEETMMYLAVQESKRQQEYDEVLRSAKQLKLDLQAVHKKTQQNLASMEQHMDQLRMQMAFESGSSTGDVPSMLALLEPETRKEYNEVQHALSDAGARVEALGDAVEELLSLEEFIRTTKPSQEEAVTLTEAIVKQLLDKLNALGIVFDTKDGSGVKAAAEAAAAAATPVTPEQPAEPILDRYRQQVPLAPSLSNLADFASAAGFKDDADAASDAGSDDLLAAAAAAAEEPEAPVLPALEEEAAAPESPAPISSPVAISELTPRDAPSGVLESHEILEKEDLVSIAGDSDRQATQEDALLDDDEDDDDGGDDAASEASEFPPSEASERSNEGGIWDTQISMLSTNMDFSQAQQHMLDAVDEEAESLNSGSSSARNYDSPHPQRAGPPRVLVPPRRPPAAATPWGHGGVGLQRTLTPGTHIDAASLAVLQSGDRERQRRQLGKTSSKIAMLLADVPRPARRSPDGGLKRLPQVVHLFVELQKVLPGEMDAGIHDDSYPTSPTGSDHSSSMEALPSEHEPQAGARKGTAAANGGTLSEEQCEVLGGLAEEVAAFRSRDIRTLLPLVERVEQALTPIKRGEEAGVLAQLEWPKARYEAMREFYAFYTELNDIAHEDQHFQLGRGSCEAEIERIEAHFDKTRARVEEMQRNARRWERRFTAERLPWPATIWKDTRKAALHLASLHMSRVLFEVANLERDTAKQDEQCLRRLAASVRLGYKVHQYCGGFDVDCAELFEKIKRLANYYVRLIDPSWLRHTQVSRDGHASNLVAPA